jgi:hypothetical protein
MSENKMKDLKSPSWKFMFGKKECKNLTHVILPYDGF